MAYPGRLKDQYISLSAQNTRFQFSLFGCISTKLANNDFIIHLIILKWLRKQKCRKKRKNETKRRRSE